MVKGIQTKAINCWSYEPTKIKNSIEFLLVRQNMKREGRTLQGKNDSFHVFSIIIDLLNYVSVDDIGTSLGLSNGASSTDETIAIGIHLLDFIFLKKSIQCPFI